MYYFLSIGLSILGFLGLYGTYLKYTKEQHKKMKFTGTCGRLNAHIFARKLNLLPWWIVKIILIYCSIV